mmetsp:Transcript_16354/g.39216  ORF Transcript_16354/g.39216 Transcript_16354/m.39216 type:complete len:724 (+) Transcript_16354:141-2312(+)
MAFRAGFNGQDADKIGKTIVLEGADAQGCLREVYRTADKSWESAMGDFPMQEKNHWGSPTYKHFFAFHLVECETVCWRMGVCSETFPVSDMWGWFSKLELGKAPPWGVMLAGGKSEVLALPPEIIKAGNLKINTNLRAPDRLPPLKKEEVVDGAGRLRLKRGDQIGVFCDLGSHMGDTVVSFFVNGHQICEPLHLFTDPDEKFFAYVCLGNSKIRVKMLHPKEAKWDTDEEHEITKADIAFEKGEPTFDGSGWLSRRKAFGLWERSWYMLGFEDLLFAHKPLVFITVHQAKNLDAKDFATGKSDPYAECRVGPRKWSTWEPKKVQGLWEKEVTEVRQGDLNPVWEETFSMEVSDMEGWLTVTVFDQDKWSKPDEIGSVSVPMHEVIKASQKAHTLKHLQHKWYVIHKDGSELASGKIQLSLRVGHKSPEEEEEEQRHKKKRLGLLRGKNAKMGRLPFDRMDHVREGENELEILVDFLPEHENVIRTLHLKADDTEQQIQWLNVMNLAVSRRIMAGKARRRLCAILEDQQSRPRNTMGEELAVLDPSTFVDFGFSRVPRMWLEHPFKRTDRKMQSNKVAFEMQCTDSDAEQIAKALENNTWCKELRLDCFTLPGFIGNRGATALARALDKNTTLESLNLSGNLISDEGADALARMIQQNRTLTKLNLNGNSIRKKGAVALFGALTGDAKNPPNIKLKELDLQFNNVPMLESGRINQCHITGDII